MSLWTLTFTWWQFLLLFVGAQMLMMLIDKGARRWRAWRAQDGPQMISQPIPSIGFDDLERCVELAESTLYRQVVSFTKGPDYAVQYASVRLLRALVDAGKGWGDGGE